MAKKVLLLSHEFPPIIGGAGIVAKDIAEYLSKNGIEITVVTNRIRGIESEDKMYNLIPVRTIPKVRFISYWNRLKQIDLSQFSKIIINDIGAAIVASMYFPIDIQRKCIVYLHGSEPDDIFIKPNLVINLFNIQEKYIKLLRNCFTIISVSNYMKERFLKVTNLWDLSHKINIIYNGVDRKIFYPKKIDLYKKLNIDESHYLLLSVSRIVKGKGYKEMYDIFKRLVKIENKYHWIIIGEGEYKRVLEKRVRDDNLINNITFIGRVERVNLSEYYSSVDVFWLLSNFEESFGLVYLESIACGTPVIARNMAGVREIITKYKNGFLVDTTEECLDLFKEKKFNYVDREVIQESSEPFSLQKNIDKIIGMI